jgi:hypothetical protein
MAMRGIEAGGRPGVGTTMTVATRPGDRLCRSVHPSLCPLWNAERMMKPMILVGVLLVVLGLTALAYQGFSYTSRDTVLDIGPIHATADRSRWVALPPVAGAAALAAGIGVLALGLHKTR